MKRDELFSNAEHEAELAMTFAESGGDDVLQRDRGGHASLASLDVLWLLMPTGG